MPRSPSHLFVPPLVASLPKHGADAHPRSATPRKRNLTPDTTSAPKSPSRRSVPPPLPSSPSKGGMGAPPLRMTSPHDRDPTSDTNVAPIHSPDAPGTGPAMPKSASRLYVPPPLVSHRPKGGAGAYLRLSNPDTPETPSHYARPIRAPGLPPMRSSNASEKPRDHQVGEESNVQLPATPRRSLPSSLSSPAAPRSRLAPRLNSPSVAGSSLYSTNTSRANPVLQARSSSVSRLSVTSGHSADRDGDDGISTPRSASRFRRTAHHSESPAAAYTTRSEACSDLEENDSGVRLVSANVILSLMVLIWHKATVERKLDYLIDHIGGTQQHSHSPSQTNSDPSEPHRKTVAAQRFKPPPARVRSARRTLILVSWPLLREYSTNLKLTENSS